MSSPNKVSSSVWGTESVLGLSDFTVVYDASVLFPAPLRDFGMSPHTI